MACLRLLRTGRRNRARAACSAPQMCPGHIFCMCTHARAMQAACEAGRACMTEKPGHRRQQNQVTGLGPAGPPHAGPGVTPGVYSHSSVGCRAVAGSERAHAAAGPQTLPYVPGAQQAAPSALHYRQLLIKCACARLRGATAGGAYVAARPPQEVQTMQRHACRNKRMRHHALAQQVTPSMCAANGKRPAEPLAGSGRFLSGLCMLHRGLKLNTHARPSSIPAPRLHASPTSTPKPHSTLGRHAQASRQAASAHAQQRLCMCAAQSPIGA